MQSFDTNKDDQRFHELREAWSRGQITWQQFEKAEEYKFSLNQLLFWESCSFWDKFRVVFGRKEYPEQDIYDTRSVDPLHRDSILSKIIEYGSKNGVMFSLKQMKSFDPLHDRNYKENWEEFVKNNSKEITNAEI